MRTAVESLRRQGSISRCSKRILHVQRGAARCAVCTTRPDPAEQKLVRCVRGAVFDVIVDMRPESPTLARTFHLVLDDSDRHALFIPSGVAHGYQTLVDDVEFMYLTDQYYVSGVEHGVRHDDPALQLPRPLEAREMTERDASWPLLPGA